jgi:hypothetical protein
MASVSLLRSAEIEHVTLDGDTASSCHTVMRNLPETVRPAVREQTRFTRLPASVILYWRLLRASAVLP